MRAIGVFLVAFVWLPAVSLAVVSGIGSQPRGMAPVVAVVAGESSPAPRVPVTGAVRAGGVAKEGVSVRFWPEGGGATVDARTDAQGAYRLELGDGVWRGAACGSAWGYEPLFWDVTVSGGRVTRFQEVSARSPAIHSTGPAAVWKAGDVIELTGRGFGCSGRVVIEFPQWKRAEVTVFRERADDRVVFVLPDPGYEKPPRAPAGLSYLEGSLTYWHGSLSSTPIGFRYEAAQAGGTPLPGSLNLGTTPEGAGKMPGSRLPLFPGK